MDNKKIVYYLFIIIIGIILITYLVFFSHDQKTQFKKLETQGIIDTAIVVRKFRGAKRKLYFEYVFVIDKDSYNGFLQYSPDYGTISIGDSILIKYLPSNPDDINLPVFHSIKINKK
jgi:hypothetical protein